VATGGPRNSCNRTSLPMLPVMPLGVAAKPWLSFPRLIQVSAVFAIGIVDVFILIGGRSKYFHPEFDVFVNGVAPCHARMGTPGEQL